MDYKNTFFCLKNSITDFRHQSGKLYVMFLDLADAFGSIDHEMMVDALRAYGYPEIIINLTKDIYTDSTFQVDTNSGLTDPIMSDIEASFRVVRTL